MAMAERRGMRKGSSRSSSRSVLVPEENGAGGRDATGRCLLCARGLR
jgi:hypothetical protein